MLDLTTETPKLAPVIANNPTIGQDELKIASPYPDKIKASVTKFREQLRSDLTKAGKTISDDKFEAISQLFLGPWLLSEGTLRRGAESQTEKELSARMQHEFVHHIYFAMSSQAPEGYRNNTFSMVKNMEKLAASEIGRSYDLLKFLNGIKSELAIIRTLLDNGYRVFLPDYLTRSDPKTKVNSETMEWDVESGVDLVGVAPNGIIYLIDAKGRKFANDEDRNEGEVNSGVTVEGLETLQQLDRLPNSLRTEIAKIRSESPNPQAPVRRARIIIPTDTTQLGKLGSLETSSCLDAISKFALLKSEHQSAIISGLNRYE